MRKKIFSTIVLVFTLTSCSEPEKTLSTDEINRNYAIKLVFLDTIVDIPQRLTKEKIKDITIECRVNNKVFNHAVSRYSPQGALIGAESMKLLGEQEIDSIVEQNEKGIWQKRLFKNVTAISNQAYNTDEKGFIVSTTDNQEQKYTYNEKGQLEHSLEFHPLEGVILSDYQYDSETGLLSQLKREIYPFSGGKKVASINVKYFYDKNNKIIQTRNTSELLAMDLAVAWEENYEKPDKYGNWTYLPLGQMKSISLSTGQEVNTNSNNGAMECYRKLNYYPDKGENK